VAVDVDMHGATPWWRPDPISATAGWPPDCATPTDIGPGRPDFASAATKATPTTVRDMTRAATAATPATATTATAGFHIDADQRQRRSQDQGNGQRPFQVCPK
jgi:hypothetical protein